MPRAELGERSEGVCPANAGGAAAPSSAIELGAISQGAPLSSSEDEIRPPNASLSLPTMAAGSISTSAAAASLAEREPGVSAPATAALTTTEPAESSRRTRLASTPSKSAVPRVSAALPAGAESSVSSSAPPSSTSSTAVGASGIAVGESLPGACCACAGL